VGVGLWGGERPKGERRVLSKKRKGGDAKDTRIPLKNEKPQKGEEGGEIAYKGIASGGKGRGKCKMLKRPHQTSPTTVHERGARNQVTRLPLKEWEEGAKHKGEDGTIAKSVGRIARNS